MKITRNGANELFLISSCGEPLLLVPARSKEDAQQRTRDLLRANPQERHLVATHGVRVTVFSPSIVADDQIIGYMPSADGVFKPAEEAIVAGH